MSFVRFQNGRIGRLVDGSVRIEDDSQKSSVFGENQSKHSLFAEFEVVFALALSYMYELMD